MESGALNTIDAFNSNNFMFNTFHLAIPLCLIKQEQESMININILDLLLKNFNDNIEHSFNIFSCDSYFRMNPFEWCCINGHYKLTRWFLINIINKDKEKYGDKIINRINKSKSIINDEYFMRIENETPIHLAIRSKNLNVVKLLCRNDADISIKNIDQENAIFVAIEMQQPLILLEIANIAKREDLFNVKGTKSALEIANNIYSKLLIEPALPTQILASWQCLQLIHARLLSICIVYTLFLFQSESDRIYKYINTSAII